MDLALPEAATGGIGYLLKDHVDDISTLLDALHRIDIGETVVDSERERQILEQMAQGRSNAGIAGELYLGVKTVERHIASLFEHLGITGDSNDNRRVLAVLTWLRSTHDVHARGPV